MTLTTVPAFAALDVWTATEWTTYLRNNLNDLIGFANGTIPFVGAQQYFANDALFYFGKASGLPLLAFDANDYFYYDRTSNVAVFNVGGASKLAINAAGEMFVNAFSSAEQTIANGGTVNVAHGLGTIPRWVMGYYNTVTNFAIKCVVPSFNSLGAHVRLMSVDGTNLTFVNETGATVYLNGFALK